MRPPREELHGFGAERLGLASLRGVSSQRLGLGGGADAKGGLEHAEHQRLVRARFGEERGEFRKRDTYRSFLNGAGRLGAQQRVFIREELRDLHPPRQPHGEQGHQAHRRIDVPGRFRDGRKVARRRQRLHVAVPEDRAVVAVRPRHQQHLRDTFLAPQFRQPLGREKTHVIHLGAQRSHQAFVSLGHAVFPEHPHRLRAHLHVLVLEEREQRGQHLRGRSGRLVFGAARRDAQPPDRVNPRQVRIGGVLAPGSGDIHQLALAVGLRAQRPGRFEPDPLIEMTQQQPQLHGRLGFEILREQQSRGFDLRVAVFGRVEHPVNPAAAARRRPRGQGADVELAVRSKRRVRGRAVCEENRLVIVPKRRQIAARFPRRDAAGGADKKMPVVLVRESDARITGDPGGAVGNVRDRRQRPRGLALGGRHPPFLRQPGIARRAERMVLPADPPAVVAALHKMQPARFVALPGPAVGGEKIPVFVEPEIARIAQPAAENLEARTVRLTAENRALLR